MTEPSRTTVAFERGAFGGAAASGVALLDVDGDQPVARRLEAELGRASGRQHHGARLVLAPAGHPVGKRRQHRQAQRARRARRPAARRRRARRHAAAPHQLAADAIDLFRGAAVELQPAQDVGAETARPPPRGTGPRDRRSRRRDRCRTRAVRRANDARVPARMSRSEISAAARHAAARQPRASPSTTSRASRGWTGRRDMRRPTSVRPPPASTAPSRDEQLARRAPRRGRRRLEPRERVGIADAERREHEQRVGEIGARDLGQRLPRALLEVVARVEAQRAPGARAAGAAGALRGGGLADLRDDQRRQPGPRRVRRDARQARIDHGDHAVDRDRRFRDVGRQDDLAPVARGARRAPAPPAASRRAAAARPGRRRRAARRSPPARGGCRRRPAETPARRRRARRAARGGRPPRPGWPAAGRRRPRRVRSRRRTSAPRCARCRRRGSRRSARRRWSPTSRPPPGRAARARAGAAARPARHRWRRGARAARRARPPPRRAAAGRRACGARTTPR